MITTTLLTTLLAAGPMSVEPASNVPDVTETTTSETTVHETTDRKETPWIRRWKPEANTWELGVYGGLMPFRNHELFGPDLNLPNQGWKPLPPVSPEFGLRLGWYPATFLGFEAEGSLLPTRLDDSSRSRVNIWNPRGHLVLQLPIASIVPFAVVGAGAMIVESPRRVLGSDVDPEFHVGGGVKFNLSRHTQLRLDLRDSVSFTKGTGQGFNDHTFEALVGFSFVLGRDKKVTKRVTKKVVTKTTPTPAPLPPDLEEFTGVIQGIHFEFDKDTIKPDSLEILDRAVVVLKKYDDVDIRIDGHTDNKGSHAYNQDLSQRRADAVRRYLVTHGIGAHRLTTYGHSFDVSVASNATDEGRALNRRIEFHIVD